jgi:hypothetical protein
MVKHTKHMTNITGYREILRVAALLRRLSHVRSRYMRGIKMNMRTLIVPSIIWHYAPMDVSGRLMPAQANGLVLQMIQAIMRDCTAND